MPTEPLKRWHAAGGKQLNVGTYDRDRTPLGKGGPLTDIKLIASFDDAKPVSVTLSFFWPRAAD
jgi:hypothetical protein